MQLNHSTGHILGRAIQYIGLLYQIVFMMQKKRAQVSSLSFYILGVGTLINAVYMDWSNLLEGWLRLIVGLLFLIVGAVAHSMK